MSSLAELEYTRDRLLGDLGNLHVEAQYVQERFQEENDNRQAALYQWGQKFLDRREAQRAELQSIQDKLMYEHDNIEDKLEHIQERFHKVHKSQQLNLHCHRGGLLQERGNLRAEIQAI